MRSSAADVGSVLVYGIHAVAALLRENRVSRLYIIDSGGGQRVQEIAAAAAAGGVPIIRQPRRELTRLVQEAHHQGVVASARLPAGDLSALLAGAAPLVVLDGVTDPRNLGAIMRVVRAFGAAAVIVPARRSAPLSAVTVRASAGAAAQIPLLRVPNIPRLLRQADKSGRVIIGAAQDGEFVLYEQALPAAVCWVFGGEGGGIGRLVREHCHYTVRIPTIGGDAGCLNVSTACAVCLAAGVARPAAGDGGGR